MAIYQGSRYGTEKYGPAIIDWTIYGPPGTDTPLATKYVDFAVEPVLAEPLGYDLISVIWHSPTGSWTGLRVLKNYTGYSINETDGEILLDTTAPAQSLIDHGVRSGAWHYYTIFVKSGGQWQRAGGTSTLMVTNHGYGQRLFDLLPLHHRSIGNDLYETPIANETLKKFLNVLGWGLDYSKTNFDSLQSLNDPRLNHVNDLARLADQLGIIYEPSAPSALFRNRVRSAAVLGREKGTLEQLQSVISMTTTLDTELSLSENLMLNDDASTFVHPVYQKYNTAFNYSTGERVRFNGFMYQCNPGGAYGQAQGPSGTAGSNAHWTSLLNTVDTVLVDADGAIAGWEPSFYSGGVKPTLVMALGVQSFTDPLDLTSNALKVLNTTGATADLGVRSIAKRLGETTTDRGQVLKFGAPIPLPLTYLPTDLYQRGTLVNFDGKVYRCLRKVVGVSPDGSLVDDQYWEIIGLDDRVNLAFSLYAKAGIGFVVPAYPVIEFFDQLGGLVATLDTETETAAGSSFASFGSRFGVLTTGRTLDNGPATWTVQNGAWTVSDINGGISWPTGAGLITIPGTADGTVSVTFDTAAAGASGQFIAFRGANAASFLKVTRTGLYSSSAGVDTLIGTHGIPFVDQDRATVNFVGTAITVMRNGVLVLTSASSFNQSAILHGLGVA